MNFILLFLGLVSLGLGVFFYLTGKSAIRSLGVGYTTTHEVMQKKIDAINKKNKITND